MTQIILNMSLSVDGFIAAESGDSAFALETLKKDTLFNNFYESIDSIVIGRRTYDYLKQNAPKMLKEKHIFVITHYLRQQEGNAVFIHENIAKTLNELKKNASKNIWLFGGAQAANVLLKEGLVDQMILTTAPILLGNGIRLFDGEGDIQNLKLEESRTFDGYVQNRYTFAK